VHQRFRNQDLLSLLRKSNPGVAFTTDLSEAGFALLFISPADKRDRKSPVLFDLEVHEKTGIDVGRLVEIERKIPTVLSVNLEMPWVLGSIEPDAGAIVAGFSTRPDAIFDVVRGVFHSTGKLPLTLPHTLDVVEKTETTGPAKSNGSSASDVPGFARPAVDQYIYVDSKGSSYRTGFGMTY
jgi:beta-glucosidase